MSLETVVDDIREEAEARAAEIREEAEEEAAAIIEEAEADANQTIADAEAAVEQRIERERDQQLSSATLQAKQDRLAARRDILEDTYDRVADALVDLDSDRREEMTQALLTAGVEALDVDETIRVYGRPSDADLLESLVAEDEQLTYGGEHECLGGVVLESDAARVRVNNTFESVLDDVWEDHLKDISDKLFES